MGNEHDRRDESWTPQTGRWPRLGEILRTCRFLNWEVAVVELRSGGFGIVGHAKTAHIEAGPFRSEQEAANRWPRVREAIETARRIQAGTAHGRARRKIRRAAKIVGEWCPRGSIAGCCADERAIGYQHARPSLIPRAIGPVTP